MPRLGHVNIRTVKLAETVAFYENVLGFRRGEAPTMDDQSTNAWMYDGEGRPCVHVNSLRPGERLRPGDGSCLDHVAFDCEDEPAVRTTLERAGIPFARKEFPRARLVQLVVHDPNGVKVELSFPL
jgi:catechol 2,3-dioxygenase-like lactoylglutathione lyase family enzyme